MPAHVALGVPLIRRHQGPRAARSPAVPAVLLILLVSLSGCSSRSLPVAPRASASAVAHEFSYGGAHKGIIVVTLSSDSDAAALADAYDATLVASGWRVAGLRPSAGQSSDDLLAKVSTDSRVLSAEEDQVIETAEMRQKSWAFDDGWGSPEACLSQSATDACNLDAALLRSRGQGVRVAILDTGAELTHPWIQGRVEGGWDFVDGDADPSEAPDGLDNDYDGCVDEGWGHGTHVAGIVGIAAPEARLEIVRVLDSEGRGDMLSVAQAIRWSVANGAKVINLSLGGPCKSDAVKLALDEAADADVVCVAAAGNSGAESVDFPASDHLTIGVAALDGADVLASFSSYGSQIGICAPGVSIRSSYRGGGFALWSGTSMAAPWVSGGAALLWAKNPGWSRNQVVDRIESTGRSIWKQNPALRTDLGGGALDLGAALADTFSGRSASVP